MVAETDFSSPAGGAPPHHCPATNGQQGPSTGNQAPSGDYTRLRTIRIHCLGLEELQLLGVQLPWSEESVRDLLNKMMNDEVTASKLSRLWRTLSWIGKRFGALRPDSVERLIRKKEFAIDSLVSSTISPQKQALVPSLQLVVSLETGLACQDLPWPTRFILGVARFMLGCSARFNDFQHCNPKDVHLTSNTIEVMAWQTKTSSLQGGKRKPSPLIAPQWSFSPGPEPRWEIVTGMFKRISAHPDLQGTDYLTPTISRGSHGIIPRPSSHSRALRWLKEALYSVHPSDELSSLTWHSTRVFMPDWAFQAQIPKEQRRYLGNWTSTEVADVYTRDKRNVVCNVWMKVCSQMGSMNFTGQRVARIDLSHPDFDDHHSCFQPE